MSRDSLSGKSDVAEELIRSRHDILILVEDASRQGELILPYVSDWLDSTNGVIFEWVHVLKQDLHHRKSSCFPFMGFHRMSQLHKLDRVSRKLLKDGNFKKVSTPDNEPPPIWRTSAGDVNLFQSQQSTFEDVMCCLNDDRHYIIGLYGMCGVGKTTLVKEIAKKANENGQFNKIVMVEVSQAPNERAIQESIAKVLKSTLVELSDAESANLLWKRITQVGHVLVILDDLWTEVDLGRIGIPNRGPCKILLVSRNQDVCKRMNAERRFFINISSEVESWVLFSTLAGLELSRSNPTASEIARRCGGLPLAIVTAAQDLGGKSDHVWKASLYQLRKLTPKNTTGLHAKVYSSLELSYNSLQTNEIKSLFLLCSLFREDEDIEVELLVRYGMGLRLFQSPDNIEEARSMAYTLLDILKDCSLLLDGKSEEYIKMHSVVRAFAISVASGGKFVFFEGDRSQSIEWSNNNASDSYTGISLVSNEQLRLPNCLHCPNLQILMLHCHHFASTKIADKFFEQMKELTVLHMTGMNFPSIPLSVKSLKKLRTLCLHHCKLRDISLIGELKDLEYLSLTGSSIKQLPTEIGELIKLRVLDVSSCQNLKVIPYNVISRLINLECLYLRHSFRDWGVDNQDTRRGNATLAELKPLSYLSSLDMEVDQVHLFPVDFLFESLIKYSIYIGSCCDPDSYSKTLQIDFGSVCFEGGMTVLLRKAEKLILKSCSSEALESALFDIQKEGFASLKCLEIFNNQEAEYLVSTMESILVSLFPVLEKLEVNWMDNLKAICHGNLSTVSFCNLRELWLSNLPELVHLFKDPIGYVSLRNLKAAYVYECRQLKMLFPQPSARDLNEFELLDVACCDNLHSIIEGDAEAVAVEFRKLKFLRLCCLRNFRSFCYETDSNLEGLTRHFIFSEKVIFPAIEELHLINLPEVDEIWHHRLSGYGPYGESGYFDHLRILRLEACGKFSKFFPAVYLIELRNLESLSVENCSSVELILEHGKSFGSEQGEPFGSEQGHLIGIIELSKLQTLELVDLGNLRCFCWSEHRLNCPSLETVKLVNCPNLETFSSGGVSTRQLKTVNLGKTSDCDVLWKGDLNSTIQHLFKVKRIPEETKEEGTPNDPGCSTCLERREGKEIFGEIVEEWDE